MTDKMRIAVEFGSYNQRRYSKPWISKVTAWAVGKSPDVEFGGYIGDDNGGEAEIMAKVGDIIRYGQKDGRGNNTESLWAVVEEGGTLRKVTMIEARKLFKEEPQRQLTPPMKIEPPTIVEREPEPQRKLTPTPGTAGGMKIELPTIQT
jgi:hypothetical protein